MPQTENSSNIHRETVREWFSRDYKWIVPVYQRHYAWEERSSAGRYGPLYLFWKVLERQARKRLEGNQMPAHYFGTILVEGKLEELQIPKYNIVDGQQRITTLNIALFAVIGASRQFNLMSEIRDKISPYTRADEESSPKLVPTNFDEQQYVELSSKALGLSRHDISGFDSKNDEKSKIVKAYEFLYAMFERFCSENEEKHSARKIIESLENAILDGFELVLIPLQKTDKAQEVFESMNSTAEPLTVFDLVRNNIFYRAAEEETGLDTKLFKEPTWQMFEDRSWEGTPGRKDGSNHIESYISHMLVAKLQEFISFSTYEIFQTYKRFASTIKSQGKKSDVRKEIEMISEYVCVYRHLTMSEGLDVGVDFGIFYHGTYKTLDLYAALFIIANCGKTSQEKQQMVKLLESYVVRRAVCGLTEKSYNQLEPRICRELSDDPSYEKLHRILKSFAGDSRLLPDDARVRESCVSVKFYKKSKFQNYIFNRIAQHSTSATMNEKRDISGLTIDHIIPQAWEDSDGWQNLLSGDRYDKYVIDEKIHTIGNLTPMAKGLNSGKSNAGWILPDDQASKRKMSARDWLKRSDLAMTREIGENNETWDIDKIIERSEKLAAQICEIWPIGDANVEKT